MPLPPPDQRQAMPLPMRVYGLEGQLSDLDTAVTRQGQTLADHDKRIGEHDVLHAVTGNTTLTMQKSFDQLVVEMQKTRWTLVAFAFTVAAAAFGVSIK